MQRGLTIFLVVLIGGGLLILWDEAEPPQRSAQDRALQALDDSQWRSPEALLAFRLHDWGDAEHWSRQANPVAIPPADDDPITGLRAIHATYVGGHGPDNTTHHALQQRLLDNVPRLQNSSNDAAISFQMLAMHAAGLDASGLRADLLARVQSLDGGVAWGCGGAPSLECTAFALWALETTGGVPDDIIEPAGSFLMQHHDDGPFTDPVVGQNVQATAWAAIGLHAATLEVPAETHAWIDAQQGDDGRWPHAGQPSAWATADVLVMQALVAP